MSQPLSIFLLFTTTTLSIQALNPTGRYLVEMSRLIRDPQLQRSSMKSVAAPLRVEEVDPNNAAATDEHDDNTYDLNAYSEQSKSVFDGTMPTQARRKMLQMTMDEMDSHDEGRMAGYDLFDALDRHLRALDEQIETSTSLGSVLDEELSSVEMEYDETVVSYNSDGDALFYEEPIDYEIQPSEPMEAAVETKNHAVLVTRPDPDNLNDSAFVTEAPSYDQSPLDAAQTQNNAHIIGTDSFGFSTIHATTHSFETYRPQHSKYVAIQHLKGPPPLPDTLDPYELLGFTMHNPPKDADHIRRAYVQRAKKYHPDALHPASNEQERALAAQNFKKINDAYRKLKDEKYRMQHDFFATTMGGAMYEPRGSGRHIRRPFSYGRDFDESESLFAGEYSARHGTRYGSETTRRFWEKRKRYDEYQHRERRDSSSSNGREKRSPFGRRNMDCDNCHVSGDQFPPFFSY